MPRDFVYEEQNSASNWQTDDGIKCKNYEVCEDVLPRWWYDCKENYLCTNCDMMFGKPLGINNDTECPICLEKKRCIAHPGCQHSTCIDCFKRCYYGDDNRDDEPKFPYPDIEDAYYDDPERWLRNYPLIRKWNDEWNKWEDERQEKYDSESNLQRCPVCRK